MPMVTRTRAPCAGELKGVGGVITIWPCVECARFSRELELPWLPDMVFPRNCLSLEHESGAGVEFWALDALKLVDAEHESVHVASAEQWRETRWALGLEFDPASLTSSPLPLLLSSE